MNLKKILLGSVAAAGCAIVVSGCVVVQHDPHYQPGSRQYTYNSGAYWYYYPQSRVYYHITERYYYYPVDGGWRRARNLPVGWVIDSRDRVRLKIAGAPYAENDQHFKKYPPRNVADQRRVPWGQAQERNVEREHPVHQERPGNHAENSQRPDKTDHSGRGQGDMNHVPHGQAKFMEDNPGNNDQPHGNSDNAPGQNRDPKGFAKHNPGKPEHDKHGKDVEKHMVGKERGKPERSVANQQRPNNKWKRENVKQNVVQEQAVPSARHGQSDKGKGKTADSDKPGKEDRYKSHERKQVNVEQVTEERSPVAADEPKAKQMQQANKGSDKNQASVSEEKGKGKNKNAKSGGNSKKRVDSSSDEEKDGQPENTRGNKGKGNGR